MSRILALLFLLPAFLPAAAPTAAELTRSLREAGFEPDECYRVRDLTFQKEDIRVYFTDGYLIFTKPVAGERVAALFSADVEGGDAEVLLFPPDRGERMSMVRFTQAPNLNEHLLTALLIATDGSVDALRANVLQQETRRKDPEIGAMLADKWASTLRNVRTGFELRLVQELLTPPTGRASMTFFAMNGKQLGSFDVLHDLRLREEVLAGQLMEHEGRYKYNVWTSFPSRDARSGARKEPVPGFTLSRYRIDATLDADLRMKVTTRATVRMGPTALRTFGFDLAHAMRVTSVRIDGQPAELLFQDSIRARALRGSDNDAFLATLAEPLAAGSEHEFEFEHEGAVITRAGNGVYYVGARSNWYPRAGANFATYELAFRYPKRLTLVTPGDLVEDRVEGEQRVTIRRIATPIRIAGFNLGEYERVAGNAVGFAIDVYGNRNLENALIPKSVIVPPVPTTVPRSPRRDSVIPALAPTPDPLARLRSVAADVSSSLEFYSSLFGPPALKTLTVAPIPGTFGQGFPGLVYLSTLAYMNPGERPAALREKNLTLFFSELLLAHEVAHQWWGNVVLSASYRDEWLSESLASYSALLWLEKKKGIKAVESVLDEYRNLLVQKGADGRTVESAGPIMWGGRLETTGVAEAWRAITYDKGAWILHMLRRRIGDDRFLKMLAELRRRHELRPVTTEEFAAIAKQFLPPRTSGEVIDSLFDNWVYSTGIPTLKLKFSSKGAAPAIKLTGTVTHAEVDDDFGADVPVEIQFPKGPSQVVWVRSSSEGTPFSLTLKQAPKAVVIGNLSVLAKR
ncbi:MAG TPA: M1 family aminopeptidase [Bryobacteraceae bacterium]|nr:M1 family aminopeptidase [Bryobacteraceae bacterium]